MTSIPVNRAKSVMMDFAAKTPGRTTAAGETGGFTDVFKGQTKESKAGQEVKSTQTESDVRTRTQTNVVKNAKDRMKQDNVSKTQTQDTQKTAEEMADVLEEAGAEIIREIAKELNVSEEDVLQAMEVLGLSMMDLFRTENLTMIVMQTMGEADPMALLTNEELGAALKTLNQFVQNLTDELQTALNIAPEQMEEPLVKTQKTVTDDVQADVSLRTVTEEEELQPQIFVEAFTTEEEDTQVKTEGQNMNEVTDTLAEGSLETETFRQVDKTTEKETGDKGTTEGQNLFFQNVGQQAEAVNAAKAQEVPFAQAQTREIMDQILEGMKVQIKPEMTQLEMQLNPASLGNVTVHIASKEGTITAQFTAQNETVKAALESQMVQLKETFAEQGVKVEAIEVSVQANGFRQEYEGSRGQENTADSKKRGPRRINLNNPAVEGEEALSEEEQLTVSMMEANGSTVDYTA